MFWRAMLLGFVACLMVSAGARHGAAPKRAPQTIPLSKTAHVVSKNATASASNRGKPSGSGAAAGWGTTLGALVAVLALIVLTAKVLRKSMPAAQKTLPFE